MGSILLAFVVALIAFLLTIWLPTLGLSVLIGMAFGGMGGWLGGGSASEIAMDAVYGGIAGMVALGVFGVTVRVLGRLAVTSSWMGRWFPRFGSGAAAGAGDTATFDALKEGKVNWKKALFAGALAGLMGIGGGWITDHGHKLKSLLPQAFEVRVVEADGPLGKFVQFVRGGSSTSASSSQLSQARIQLLDSINFRNLKGTTNEDRLRRVFEQHQIDLEDLPYIRNKLTPQQRGVLGEVLMERRMAALGYEQLPTKVGGNRNNGIDGLFIMRNDRGEIEHIVVVESK
ncbi:hypothetical protein ACFQ49_06260, partial [Kroppenstedtia eburnea]